MSYEIIQGDALTELRKLPSNYVDCCITSPPYWALRDYKVDGQLGLEPTFSEYIDKLVAIFDEIKRVLKKTGTCFVVMGDTYAGNGTNRNGLSGSGLTSPGKGKDSGSHTSIKRELDIPEKSLCLIPSRFAIAMIEHQWVLRNDLIWHKPNCMPSSARDRFTVDYEHVFFFVKSKQYAFETQYEPNDTTVTSGWEKQRAKGIDTAKYNSEDGKNWNGAIKDGRQPQSFHKPKRQGVGQCERYYFETQYEPLQESSIERDKYPRLVKNGGHYAITREHTTNGYGRIKRCVWKIPTAPFKDAHFAVFPPKLVEPMIKAGCPSEVCKKCGKPRVTLYETIGYRQEKPRGIKPINPDRDYGSKSVFNTNQTAVKSITGLTDCGCNAGFSPGLVLDCFAGSGTVGMVASQLARDFIGIEISADYVAMANKRLEPYILQSRLLT